MWLIEKLFLVVSARPLIRRLNLGMEIIEALPQMLL
jgi:hypothetical protein